MSEMDPLAKRYLESFRRGLSGLPPEEQRELLSEIEDHIAEAGARGEPASEVLERLGPADRLARAYRAELMIQDGGRSWPVRVFGVSLLLIGASIPSLILIPLLGGLGLGFTFGGIALFAWSICPFDAHRLYSLPGVLDRLARAGTGAAFLAGGMLALAALYGYVRLLASAMRRMTSA